MGKLYNFGKSIVPIIVRILFKLETEGMENINEVKGGCIICANHRSNMDPLFIGCVVKDRPMRFMAKAELFKTKIGAWFFEKLGAFPVHRGEKDNTAITTAINLIQNGEALAIFPEGTRSKTGKPLSPRSGVALFADQCQVPVIPIGISFGKKLRFRTKLTVRAGKPILPCELESVANNTFALRRNAKYIMDKVISLIDPLE